MERKDRANINNTNGCYVEAGRERTLSVYLLLLSTVPMSFNGSFLILSSRQPSELSDIWVQRTYQKSPTDK